MIYFLTAYTEIPKAVVWVSFFFCAGNDRVNLGTFTLGGVGMKFYTIKLPRFLGSFVKAILNTFSKN